MTTPGAKLAYLKAVKTSSSPPLRRPDGMSQLLLKPLLVTKGVNPTNYTGKIQLTGSNE